jgi:hypothetical protein
MIALDLTIDAALLFQRFIVVSDSGDLFLGEGLTFELTSYLQLFETMNILRKADKPQLDQVIREYPKDFSSEAVMDTLFLWQTATCYMGALYFIVCLGRKESCVELTVRNYKLASVVFDGNGAGASIKDNTHQRRRKPCIQSLAEFTGKKASLCDKNTTAMITLISAALVSKGCQVIQSPGDAELDIVR